MTNRFDERIAKVWSRVLHDFIFPNGHHVYQCPN
jgi:hypothetical protein